MDYKKFYKEKGVIGRGNFGVASIVVEKSTGIEYVAKKITQVSLNEYELKQCQLEAKLLESLDHEHIVKYKETFSEPGLMIIIMEYCRGGDLSQLIRTHIQCRSYFPEAQIREWMLQLLSALQYLDSKYIIHRDIKSSNIYLTETGKLKLGDFGIAKVLSSTSDVAKTLVGTPYYLSPEVCENRPYCRKSDIWSLGVLFYELTALRHPFAGTSFLALVMNILKETPPEMPGNYSNEMKQIIITMLTKDMKIRPSAKDILKMKYFTKDEDNDDYFNEEDYEVSVSEESNSEEIKSFVNTDMLGVSGINPLDLVNTENFGNSDVSNDFNYEFIPTFTPDVQIDGGNTFLSSIAMKKNDKVCDKGKKDDDEDEYEDDFDSESSSDQPYDDDFDEANHQFVDDGRKLKDERNEGFRVREKGKMY
ncbi:hypothetical protein SteCoe_22773 [Stentor coeruleus]|uniref:non-specific serine/threonine protein kinase n=1 Tax=Stentor coeruleus TaxID=5963 RepID=A0A1R2BLK5_9CILI|nr:hypothetical protein SteCoe_22773 [Stentor coeruleus]